VAGETLVLGPFEGAPTEHERIRMGQGVCGSVAALGRTEVVPDVRKRPGHIACDINTRSEVVAPIIREGEVIGVLDVDSNTLDAFGEREVERIEAAAKGIGANA
jgi:L-methionine (R)-S-oxide reductase